MYNGIMKIKEVLECIEENITGDIRCDDLAQKMNLSLYEFRRIFSFVVGCPFAEYVRKRRLSLAACEIAASHKPDLIAISAKYGYASQAAFIKAFKEHHGCTPTEYMKNPQDIMLFTVPRFEVSVLGGDTVPFRIIEDDAFYISGYSGISTLSDSCCCEGVWSDFFEMGFDKAITSDRIYVSYKNDENSVGCLIGERASDSETGEKIPASGWACFKVNTTDDDIINELYGKIIYEWLPSAKLSVRKDIPTVEVFPSDMGEEGFEWEIRIPIE